MPWFKDVGSRTTSIFSFERIITMICTPIWKEKVMLKLKPYSDFSFPEMFQQGRIETHAQVLPPQRSFDI